MGLDTQNPEFGLATEATASPSAIGVRGWTTLLLVVLGYAAYNLDKSVLSVLIEPIKAEFSLKDSDIGLLTGLAMSLPFAVACLPLGALADRRSRKWMLVVLIAGWSVTTGLSGLATTVTFLFLARMSVGAFEAGFSPTSISLLSDSFPLGKRSTAMGLFALGAPLGNFLGMAIGGAVAGYSGWRAAFFLAGAPGIVIAVLIALAVREPQRGRFDLHRVAEPAPTILATVRHIIRDRALLHIGLAMTWCATILAAIAIWTPSLLMRRFHFSHAEAGLSAAVVVGVCGAVGAAVAGILSDKIGRDHMWRRLLCPVAGTALSILCGLLGLVGVNDAIPCLVLLGLAAFFGQFYIGTGYGVASSIAPAAMRGTVMSVFLLSFNLVSYTLGAAFVGYVSDIASRMGKGQPLAIGLAAAFLFSVLGMIQFARAMAILRASGER